MATNKQAYTHMCNAVMLVWYSLKLTPTIVGGLKTRKCWQQTHYGQTYLDY